MKIRQTKQAVETARKKGLILKNALSLFQEYGYEQTTVRQICQVCGISTGSFYHFFGDKLGLLRDLYIRMQVVGKQYLELTEENLSHPFQSILDAMICATNVLCQLPPDLSQCLLTESTKIMNGKYDVPKSDTIQYQVQRLLEEAKKNGSVSAALNPSDAAIYCIAVSTGFTNYWLYRDPSASMEKMAEIILIPAYQGLSKEKLVYHAPDKTADFFSMN